MKQGDTVHIRDVLKSRDFTSSVLAAAGNIVITADEARFIEVFENGWNAAGTRHLLHSGD